MHDVKVERDVRIPTAEPGVTLSGDLFRPCTPEPVPLLLMALPYRRDIIAMGGSPAERFFAANGYATLLIDLRGTGSSDGDPRPAFDPGEADDALAAIDWAVAQPWCDGNIGMWGHSYGAMTAMRTAARRPAALKAILAVQGTDDPGHDFVHPGGVRGALGPLGLWAVGSLLNQLVPPVDDYACAAERERWAARRSADPVVLDFLSHGPDSPIWTERRIDAGAIEVPALCLAGWRDLFCDGQVRAFERMRGPKQLIAGPWMHSSPQDSPWAPIDFASLALAWWDRWLRGIHDDAADASSGAEPALHPKTPVRLYVQGDRPRWIATDLAKARPWPLTGWRTSFSGFDHAAGLDSGLWAFPFGAFGLPRDQHGDDTRSLTLTSPPLEDPLLIAGRPVVTVEHSWPQISVKLTDVDPQGRSTLITAGLSPRPGDVTLAATCYELGPGHRLRISVAPVDFPRVWPAPAEGGVPVVTSLSVPVVTSLPLPEPVEPVEPVEATEVQMPAVPAPPAGPAPPAAPAPPPLAALPVLPVWEVTEDLITGKVSLRLGYDGTVITRPPHRGHTVHATQAVTATASRTDPDAAALDGSLVTTVETETGQRIHTAIRFHFTAAEAHISAQIDADGRIVLDRAWDISTKGLPDENY